MSSAIEEYNMNHSNRGTALIISNEYFDRHQRRKGCEADENELVTRLTVLEFDVRVCRNLKRKEMINTMKEVSREDHRDRDCFVCVILSHGEKDKVCGTDDPVEVNDLLGPFKGDRCQTLAGKPKIFFIQACRGSRIDVGTTLGVQGDGDDDDADPVPQKIPTEADFLVAYSCVQGFVSWRDTRYGSWFIQALCEVLDDYGTTYDLLTLMTLMNRKVAKMFDSSNRRKQIPCITSMLTKNVYFRSRMVKCD